MRSLNRIFLVLVGVTAACSAASSPSMFGDSGSGASSSTGNGGATAGSGSNGSNGSSTSGNGGFTFAVSGSNSGSTGSGTSSCVVTNPDVDMDMDGWTPNQGDCNDCDPNVNPGAIDVIPVPTADGGVGVEVLSDCKSTFDPPVPCDMGLALTDVDPGDAAKAIELCQTTVASPATPQQKTWGVLSSQYVRADGTNYPNPGLQVGIQSGFGPNVHVQGGSNMLLISSGHARIPGQAGNCTTNSCYDDGEGTAPPSFPQDNPNCPPSEDIWDDIGLELSIRTPTNATGYSFSFKFYSNEFPTWVCNSYNDQFIALVNPAPPGAINGNISFDSMHNPVSVNLGFFNVCDPTQIGDYAIECCGPTCPSPPNPYCSSGTAELQGTGFNVVDAEYGGAGATSWLKSQAPVKGGTDITIRFAMWDTGDDNFDSSTLIDDFQWIATPGTNVTVGTAPIPNPQ